MESHLNPDASTNNPPGRASCVPLPNHSSPGAPLWAQLGAGQSKLNNSLHHQVLHGPVNANTHASLNPGPEHTPDSPAGMIARGKEGMKQELTQFRLLYTSPRIQRSTGVEAGAHGAAAASGLDNFQSSSCSSPHGHGAPAAWQDMSDHSPARGPEGAMTAAPSRWHVPSSPMPPMGPHSAILHNSPHQWILDSQGLTKVQPAAPAIASLCAEPQPSFGHLPGSPQAMIAGALHSIERDIACLDHLSSIGGRVPGAEGVDDAMGVLAAASELQELGFIDDSSCRHPFAVGPPGFVQDKFASSAMHGSPMRLPPPASPMHPLPHPRGSPHKLSCLQVWDSPGVGQAWEENAAVRIGNYKSEIDELRLENQRLSALLEGTEGGKQLSLLLEETKAAGSDVQQLLKKQLQQQYTREDLLQSQLHHSRQQVLALQQQLDLAEKAIVWLQTQAAMAAAAGNGSADNTLPSFAQHTEAIAAATERVAQLESQLAAQKGVHDSQAKASKLCLQSARQAAAQHEQKVLQIQQQMREVEQQQVQLKTKQQEDSRELAAAQLQKAAATAAKQRAQRELNDAKARCAQIVTVNQALQAQVTAAQQHEAAATVAHQAVHKELAEAKATSMQIVAVNRDLQGQLELAVHKSLSLQKDLQYAQAICDAAKALSKERSKLCEAYRQWQALQDQQDQLSGLQSLFDTKLRQQVYEAKQQILVQVHRIAAAADPLQPADNTRLLAAAQQEVDIQHIRGSLIGI